MMICKTEMIENEICPYSQMVEHKNLFLFVNVAVGNLGRGEGESEVSGGLL